MITRMARIVRDPRIWLLVGLGLVVVAAVELMPIVQHVMVAAVELIPVVQDLTELVLVKAWRGVLALLGAGASFWLVNRTTKRIEEEIAELKLLGDSIKQLGAAFRTHPTECGGNWIHGWTPTAFSLTCDRCEWSVALPRTACGGKEIG
jgi:hypothetical protein